MAEGLIGAGDSDAAFVTLERAVVAIEKPNERFFEAEAHRLRGEALLNASAQAL